MGGLHEVSTYHGECNAVPMLGWELHALFKLVLKYGCVEAETEMETF